VVDQPDMFRADGVGEVGDELDRHYTPDRLALIICERLAEHITPPRTIIEPSVGGGAFARAARKVWPGVYIIGVDIDPQAEGAKYCDEFIVGDFVELAATGKLSADMVLGNPPFSGKTDAQLMRTIAHVRTACHIGKAACLLLPWGPFGGVDQWAPIFRGKNAPDNAWPVTGPRPWPEHVRETAAYLWRGKVQSAHGTLVRPLPRWKA